VNAPRGLIYDAQGHLLATNVVRDDVYIEPIQFWTDHQDTVQAQADLSTLIAQLHQVLGVSEEKLQKAFNSGLATYPLATYLIARSISPDQTQALRTLRLSYVFFGATCRACLSAG